MNTTACHFHTIMFLGAVIGMRLEREYHHGPNGWHGVRPCGSFKPRRQSVRFSKNGVITIRQVGRK